MLIDALAQFSKSGDFAIETGTENVGDIIDLGATPGDLGVHPPMFCHIVVETAADGGGGGTGTTAFQVVSDGTTTISTTTATVHVRSQVFVAADLAVGRHIVLPLPSAGEGAASYERYLGLQIVQATEGEDDLVCSAWLSPFPGRNLVSYPDAANSN